MPVAAGEFLGPYRITALIGEGGMGAVYRAHDPRLGRDVAIKLSKEQFTDRFEREARAIAALNHPNICHIYDVGPNYIVMEYIEGSPISPSDSPRKLIELAVQVADGMSAAHVAGIVHRDLKPDNILVTREGRVTILDFGLAKALNRDCSEDRTMAGTDPGTVVGTAAYMSPEQARGDAVIGPQSDQFSFGLILYELVAGKRAFQGGSAAETMAAIIRDDPATLPTSAPTMLRWVIERCLAKDPAERYDSTRDLYRDLRQIRERSYEGIAASPVTKGRRNYALAGLPVAVTMTFFVAAFWPIPASSPSPAIPFAAESDVQIMPRWSPGGDRIAYVADVDGVLQIFTKTLGSTTRTQITHEKESCLDPMWSADATRIYFIEGRRPAISLRSVAVAGGDSEKVLNGVYKADLSPNGKEMALLVSDSDGLDRYRLAFSSPPGSPAKRYLQPPFAEFSGPTATNIQFDRAGKYLGLFTNERSGKNEFWRIPLDGGVPEEMLHGKGDPTSHFIWLENGGGNGPRIVTDREPLNPRYHLRLTVLANGISRDITAGAARDATAALSPDASTLAFASGELGFDIIEVPLDGAIPRDVIATSRGEAAPAWAPDGVHFAYVTDRSGPYELWLRNRVDGSERLIAGARDLPEWDTLADSAISPDGSRVAYRGQGKRAAIWISPLSGEAPIRLWKDPAQGAQRGSSWSPDGNWIAYYGDRGGRMAVMKARVGGDSPSQLLAYMARYQPVRWSPRGDWIAFRDGETLRLVSPDGKQNRVISRRVWETYGWSKDGNALYGIGYGGNRRLILGKIDLASEAETQIADLGPVPPSIDLSDSLHELSYRGFSLHPDGKSFLTSVLRAKMQIYLMKDFDRPVRLADRFTSRLWSRP